MSQVPTYIELTSKYNIIGFKNYCRLCVYIKYRKLYIYIFNNSYLANIVWRACQCLFKVTLNSINTWFKQEVFSIGHLYFCFSINTLNLCLKVGHLEHKIYFPSLNKGFKQWTVLYDWDVNTHLRCILIRCHFHIPYWILLYLSDVKY